MSGGNAGQGLEVMARQALRGHACLPASASQRMIKDSLLEAAHGLLRDPTMPLNLVFMWL